MSRNIIKCSVFFCQIDRRKRTRTEIVVKSEIEHGLSFIVSKFVLIIFKWFADGELELLNGNTRNLYFSANQGL